MDNKSKKNEKIKAKDNSCNRVVIVQSILSAVILALLVFLSSKASDDALKSDYKALMQWDISGEMAAAAESAKQYLYGKNMWSVEDVAVTLYDEDTTVYETSAEDTCVTAEATTESTTAETDSTVFEEETTSEISAAGGVDLENYEAAENTSFAPVKTTSKILSPIENPKYTSYFGYRISPITGERSFHTGLDMAAPKGTKIRAAFSGTVSKIGEDSRAGKYIFLTHSDGFVTFYCHCSEILADEGANIRQGETVAKVGSTGWSTGPHLHFEVRKDGVRLNPLWLLKNDC